MIKQLFILINDNKTKAGAAMTEELIYYESQPDK